MKRSIFISYRREDTAGHAGRLRDSLDRQLGSQIKIFRDLEVIQPGEDFVSTVERAVASCQVLLAIIGGRWTTIADQAGQPRLLRTDDPVCLEITTALSRDVMVIPVLVQDAKMPRAEELPEALSKMTRLNALELSDARWKHDVGRLVERLRNALFPPEATPEGATLRPLLPLEVFWSGAPYRRQVRASPFLAPLVRGDDIDVFISHAAVDAPWAARLHDGLRNFGLNVHLSSSHNAAGSERYENGEVALRGARQMVVLWSEAARQSSGVVRERAIFDALAPRAGPGREITVLLLEGSPPAWWSRGLLIQDLRDAAVYDTGAALVDSGLWRRVVRTVCEAVVKGGVTSVPVLVMACKRPQIEAINPAQRPFFGAGLDEVLSSLGIEVVDQLAESYGDARTDWRPPGLKTSIGTYLDEALAKVNKRSERLFFWEHLESGFWSDDHATARGEAEMLQQGACLVVIDSVSLYHLDVLKRLGLLDGCLRNPKAVIMVFWPDVKGDLRDWILEKNCLQGRLPVADLSREAEDLVALLGHQLLGDEPSPRPLFLRPD